MGMPVPSRNELERFESFFEKRRAGFPFANSITAEAKMASGWMDPDHCHNLMVLIESTVAPLLIQHPAPVCLELDVANDEPIPGNSKWVAQLVRLVCEQSLQAMPDGGDILITSCSDATGFELEIADSGSDKEERPCVVPLSAKALSAELQWQNCPQGGVAVTIRFPGETKKQRMAA